MDVSQEKRDRRVALVSRSLYFICRKIEEPHPGGGCCGGEDESRELFTFSAGFPNAAEGAVFTTKAHQE